MKCPKIIEHSNYPSGAISSDPVDCLKEECAWWDQEHSQCSMRTISNALVKIKDSMPH
ncbi:hypothetical protein LCGC14_0476860 [marine sediment metagenome]|uniref:Uncharacterized protein n=1 Tax=marine sediment metagenome TaxID=412755 RepID=A0A0F9SFQ7_9ZZZZ